MYVLHARLGRWPRMAPEVRWACIAPSEKVPEIRLVERPAPSVAALRGETALELFEQAGWPPLLIGTH